MRGPGESPFQLRNAPMRRRIVAAKKKLKTIQERRRRTRKHRRLPLVALVGYTNAGKSTLLNVLASANAYVDDRLFATLDTKTKIVHLPDDRNVLVTDTVGFIRNLPHGLVASFRSTLEEVSEADLLLIVADTSHASLPDHLDVVTATLRDIDAMNVPAILVLNKIDKADPGGVMEEFRGTFEDISCVSAVKKRGLASLKKAIASKLPPPPVLKPAEGWKELV